MRKFTNLLIILGFFTYTLPPLAAQVAEERPWKPRWFLKKGSSSPSLEEVHRILKRNPQLQPWAQEFLVSKKQSKKDQATEASTLHSLYLSCEDPDIRLKAFQCLRGKDYALSIENQQKLVRLFLKPDLLLNQKELILTSILEYLDAYRLRLQQQPSYDKLSNDYSSRINLISQIAQKNLSLPAQQYTDTIISLFNLARAQASNFPY